MNRINRSGFDKYLLAYFACLSEQPIAKMEERRGVVDRGGKEWTERQHPWLVSPVKKQRRGEIYCTSLVDIFQSFLAASTQIIRNASRIGSTSRVSRLESNCPKMGGLVINRKRALYLKGPVGTPSSYLGT